MPYSLNIANAVSKTVRKFATLNNYQLAGHLANLDFWTRQVKHALDALDGYPKRQRALEQAQEHYITSHDTRRFFPEDLALQREYPDEPCYETGAARSDRVHIASETLKLAQRDVVDAFYRFLKRCHAEGVLNSDAAKQALDQCGIGIEPGDFCD
jgi:hypothetical protein